MKMHYKIILLGILGVINSNQLFSLSFSNVIPSVIQEYPLTALIFAGISLNMTSNKNTRLVCIGSVIAANCLYTYCKNYNIREEEKRRKNKHKDDYDDEIKSVFSDIILAYAMLWSSSLVHELGHGLTNYFLRGDVLDIDIGLNCGQKPILDFNSIKIYSFHPRPGGKMRYSLPITPLHDLLVSLAGPLSSMFFNYVLSKFLPKNKEISRLCALYQMIEQPLMNLDPRDCWEQKTDGYFIWRDLNFIIMGLRSTIHDFFQKPISIYPRIVRK